MSPATGTAGSAFSGLQLNFGQVYTEDWPDDIDPVNGSQVIMQYSQIRSQSTYRKAGIMFTGTFGQSQLQGQLVYLAFPFETVSSLEQRQNFMIKVLGYFNVISGIKEPLLNYPKEFSISQNYPNPFNSTTQFDINLPVKGKVDIKIFDMLGREVQTVLDSIYPAGAYTFSWNANGFASGIYLLKMQAGDFIRSKKMILLK